jgi:hypothetical protein
MNAACPLPEAPTSFLVANLFAYAVDRVELRPAVEHGMLSPLGAALSFAPSSVRGTTCWHSRGASVSVEANGGWSVQLEPLGAREEHTNFGLVRTDFVQPYGRFIGRVRGHDITGAFGVVETHLSVW